jgi:hypothetical protein
LCNPSEACRFVTVNGVYRIAGSWTAASVSTTPRRTLTREGVVRFVPVPSPGERSVGVTSQARTFPPLPTHVLLTSSADLHASPEQSLNAARRSLR